MGSPWWAHARAHRAQGPSGTWLKHSPAQPDFWISGNLVLEIWNQKKKTNLSKSKSMSPKMLARSGLAGKRSSRRPFRHFSTYPKKQQQNTNFAYFSWWTNGPYSSGLGSCARFLFWTALPDLCSKRYHCRPDPPNHSWMAGSLGWLTRIWTFSGDRSAEHMPKVTLQNNNTFTLKLLDLGHRTLNRRENNSGWPMPPNTELED